ncbi:unnamed protein product [Ceutorhynchus assimilis]|uniref:Uncharacterized protein n=1 Tax=Ceutorhynchus assimilis TaxID=467358 RepID=A0A9N9MYQ4_9CUCU|nr:unnamed protein product [Ceutorhynchus assimilis]
MWEKPRVDGKRVLKCNAVPTIFASSSTQPRSQRKPVSQKKSHFLHDAVLASSAGPSTSSLHLPQQEPKSLPEVSDKSSTSKVDSGVHPPASQKTSNSKCTSCNKNLPEILKKYRLLYLRERRKVAQYKKLLQIQHEKQTIKNE